MKVPKKLIITICMIYMWTKSKSKWRRRKVRMTVIVLVNLVRVYQKYTRGIVVTTTRADGLNI